MGHDVNDQHTRGNRLPPYRAAPWMAPTGEADPAPTHAPWVQGEAPAETAIPVVAWLDERTAAQVRAIVAAVARAYPEVVAAILFGSIARHDERPLSDPRPSDVDLLFVLDLARCSGAETTYPLAREVALHRTIADAADRAAGVPREVRVLLVEEDLARWDEAFIANVARDGRLVWARGQLPQPWRHLATPRLPAATPPPPSPANRQ